MAFNTKILIDKDSLVESLQKGLSMPQMAEKYKCSVDTIRGNLRKYSLTPLGSSELNKGEKNPAKREHVRKKIAKTVSTLWEDGIYSNRINGMLGKTKWKNHLYQGHKTDYRDYLSIYQDIEKCSLCPGRNIKIDVHHVDDNHKNWLITNLEPLCVNCHQEYHLNAHKLPFVTIGVRSSFAAAHHLNDYDGLCKNVHGHEWKYLVKIKKRINPNTGMAIDFKLVKTKLEEHVNLVLDHSNLNDFLPFNPTAENIAVWIFEVLSKKALLKGIASVTVWEAENSSVEITSEDMLEIEKNKEIDIQVGGQ